MLSRSEQSANGSPWNHNDDQDFKHHDPIPYAMMDPPLSVFRRQARPPTILPVVLSTTFRALTTSTPLSTKKTPLPPRPTLPDSSLHHVYLKGSGPGGQKINKTNSAVQITHITTGTVVKSQATRSRSQNHKIAKQILAEKIELLEKGEESRAAKKIEVKSKRKASAVKKARRKYRDLAEGKRDGTAGSQDTSADSEGVEHEKIGEVEEAREVIAISRSPSRKHQSRV